VSSSVSDEGFIQDYEFGVRQELYIYCRLCRNTFPVAFKPKTDQVKLKCLCGHEGPLAQLDVFSSETSALDHAAFYEKVYRAAKDALKDAGLPIPPSARIRMEDLQENSGIVSHSYNELEDRSDILSSYQEGEDETFDRDAEAVEEQLAEFDDQLRQANHDPLRYHELLSDQVEWTYVRRHMHPRVLERFVEVCRKDMALTPAVIREAKALRQQGKKVRLTFSSFKHLFIHYEEEGRLRDAIEVAERAAELGLRGYAEKAQDLRSRASRS
jgi:hypothetical protein